MWPNAHLKQFWTATLFIAGTFYPFVVYFGLQYIPAQTWAVLALCITIGRFLGMRRLKSMLPLLAALLASAALQALSLFWQADLAMLLYPTLMGLSFTLAFFYTLFSPPSMVERFATLRQPVPAEAQSYLYKVTLVWVCFLLLNTLASAGTVYDALHSDLQLWTLYNGLISYLLMGLLFVGEWLLRPYWKRHHDSTALL
ncbi:hypothetical protein [Candidatus Magnetaquicoccus inordinatus]|uniref:COG4648 family protein n=1 Tax=Candidatus Magnetaquicoccus inordinatus TaxID=2496818 RepID=UPI00102AEA0D|nr:hypothetical protein [Candidatus Magnetaquicoccus inordinatus]